MSAEPPAAPPTPEPAEDPTGAAALAAGAQRFQAHMRRANALVAERRLADAEREIARALDAAPDDLRALKLLALVRFRLGRLEEAGAAYRRVTEAAPADGAARLNLGLIALKLERFADAADELGTAVRLRPDDPRTHGYLAYALQRLGRNAEAAEAFRRAGQPDLAAQLDGRAAADGARDQRAQAALPNTWVTAGAQATLLASLVTPAAAPVPDPAPALPPPPLPRLTRVESSLLSSFAVGRLVEPEALAADAPFASQDVFRFPVDGEAFVSAGCLVSLEGPLAVTLAHRRRRGRETDERLVSGPHPMFRCRGRGELWVGPTGAGSDLVVLELEDDVVFLRSDVVQGFAGALVWDLGVVPGTALEMTHFHGSGRLMVDWGGADVVALRVSEARRPTVVESRVLGWVGRVVAQAVQAPAGAPAPDPGVALVATEGEGVLLIARYRHGQPRESVHQRAEPGDDGPRGPHPRGAAVHR
jgi:hypothetical protein